MAIYLDYNATTPLDKSVVEAISSSCEENWGNPSSTYKRGQIAKNAIQIARSQKEVLTKFFTFLMLLLDLILTYFSGKN